ncbi:putative 4-coumarate--CoA ligase-like 5-like protein [Tanacetum coccineum]
MSSSSFGSLKDVHDSVNNLLRSPDIKQVLSHHKQDQKWIQQVSESSLKMLDSCGTTKDILCLVKGHIQELQSTFHRASLGETEKKLTTYHVQRKGLRKQMLARLNSLKKLKNMTTRDGHDTPVDDNLMVVANVLKDVRETIVILLESIMSLMSMPNPNFEPKKTIMNCSGVFTAKVKFTRVNSLSPWADCDVQVLQSAIERLEAVESAMEDLEVELGCIFKRLMRTRVLLLNILTN